MGVVNRKIKEESVENLTPIPIKLLDGENVSTDGHTRMFALSLLGYDEVVCEWEDIEMDWEAYRIYVKWCKDEGITTIHDLKGKIVNTYDYQRLWLDRCRVMEEELEAQRTDGK
ncbi:MAG: hypothetical protein RTU92_03045 [Candidatus Thorarchaeota archaeon]